MLNIYQFAANCLVVIHLAYASAVVFGLPAIWIGILRRQQWVRNFWWRFGHLSMILIVVAESWAGVPCPLTVWEYRLRELAHQETVKGDFLANLVHSCLFFEAPRWAFTMAYTLFGLLVLASFVVAPPRRPPFLKPPDAPAPS